MSPGITGIAAAARRFLTPNFTFIERSPQVYAWQGVAFDGTHYYVTAYFTSATQQWTLLKYDRAWSLVGLQNMGAFGDAAHTQINGIHYEASSGKLFVCANNYSTTPARGWVFRVDPATLAQETYWELSGARWTEHIVRYGTFWWETNASAHQIRQFDDAFTLVNSYTLPDSDPGNLYWQGLFVIDEVFYLNLHEGSGGDLRAYVWNGSGFTARASSISRPSVDCTQSVYYDGKNVFWAERVGVFPPIEGYVIRSRATTDLIINGAPITKARQNVAYDGFSVTGLGGAGSYVYTVAAGSLPTGLSLNSSTGAVSGTPTGTGTSSGIVLRVTDAAGDYAELPAFSITVVAALAGPWEEIGRQSTVSGGALTITGLETVGLAAINILIAGVTVTTDDTSIRLAVDYAGLQFDSATNGQSSGNNTNDQAATIQDYMILTGTTTGWGVGNASTESFGADVMIDLPRSQALHRKAAFDAAYVAPSGQVVNVFGEGVRRDISPVDTIKVYGSSNLTGGTVIVLGLQ